MKKEFKKRVNKKVLLLSLILLSFIIISLVLVYAADSTTTDTSGTPSFFERWVAGSFKDSQAKLLLWLMLFIVLLVLLQSLGLNMGFAALISLPASFILVAYVTPASIIGVFKSYQTLPLVLATFLPIAILMGFTYLSIVKGSRTLMTTQWLLWLVYFLYCVMKIFFSAWIYWDWGNLQYIGQILTLPSEAESFWYWGSVFASTLVSFIMVTFSGSFMNWAMKKTMGIEDVAAHRTMMGAAQMAKELEGMHQEIAKK